MRAFVAIELPDAVRENLRALSNQLRGEAAGASWVHPDRMHLTLRFLGDVAPDRLQRIDNALGSACAETSPFELRVAGLGAFPNLRRPSVLWIGCEPLEPLLAQLQTACERIVQQAGLPPEPKTFHPHITLARVRDPRRADGLAQAVQAAQKCEAGAFTVGHVSLFSSELTPRGPIYTRMQEYSLR